MGICSWALWRQGGLQPSVGGRRFSEPMPLFATSGGTATIDQRTCTSSNAGHSAAMGAVGGQWSSAGAAMTRIRLRPAPGNMASEKSSGLVERKRPESQ